MTDNEKFKKLYSKTQAMDKTINFTELRMLFTKTSDYHPLAPPDENQELMMQYYDQQKVGKAWEFAEKLLKNDPLHLFAHFISREKKPFHEFILTGIINSIMNSGSGKNAESAFQVISINEEYFILNMIGSNIISHELIEINNQKFDLFNIHNPANDLHQEVYFNVDVIHQELIQ